ncbi:MAG: glycosyltransferase family 4 protein [Planctomycetota bacterium]
MSTATRGTREQMAVTRPLRIVQLTPGTGSSYCGNCLRDSALLGGLRRLGHDATMASLYLPTYTEDGELPSRVFMGGINMYLRHRAPLFARAAAATRTWLDRPGLLRWASRMSDMTDAAKHADLTVAMLEGDESPELQTMLDHLEEHDRPDVVCLCNALLVGLAGPIRRRLGVPVVMTMHGEDAYLDSLPEPYRSQAWQAMRDRATDVDAFVGVSRYYADVMAERMAIPAERLRVVHNGIHPANPDPRAAPDAFTIGYLARMCSDKGLDTLVDAFIELAARGHDAVTLNAAGVLLKPDRAYVAEQERKLRNAGLADRARFSGNVTADEKHAMLRTLSVLSVPALYGEAFGLYLIEAMSHGVPVVQPHHAAFPEIIERTQGGLLCEPGDATSLAETIERLIGDPSLAATLGAAGHRAVHSGMTADHMAEDFARILHESVDGARERPVPSHAIEDAAPADA